MLYLHIPKTLRVLYNRKYFFFLTIMDYFQPVRHILVQKDIGVSEKSFYDKLSQCINEGVLQIKDKSTHVYLNDRLQYLLHKLNIHSDCVQDLYYLRTTLRNVAFICKYFHFDAFVKKHFNPKTHKCTLPRDRGFAFDHCLECIFIKYYKNCIVCDEFKQLLYDIDQSFTPEIEFHFKTSKEYVPCVSLFKKYTDNQLALKQNSPVSWLSVIFHLMKPLNEDFSRRFLEIFTEFISMYDFIIDAKCRSDFFCTVFIPIMDDIACIDCYKGEYSFLLLLLCIAALMFGKHLLIENILQYSQHTKLQFSLQKLFNAPTFYSTALNLIALKPFPNKYSDTFHPSYAQLAMSPILYNYDQKNFPHRGILSQLFLFAAGAEITYMEDIDSIIISGEDLLCRIPPEWENLLKIYNTNFRFWSKEQKTIDFKEHLSALYTQHASQVSFSILPNDAYMALYYISRVLSYYMNIKQFDSESVIYGLYDNILEEILKKPIENSKDTAEKVILKLQKHIEMIADISPKYTIPGKQTIDFDFLKEVSGSKVKPVSFFKISNPNSGEKHIEEYGQYIPSSKLSKPDKSAIRLILYLSTILQIEQALQVKPFLDCYSHKPKKYFAALSEIQWLDMNFYTQLLYTLRPGDKGHKSLHCIFKKGKTTKLGLGMLRLLCIIKRPKNPNIILLKLISKLHSANIEEDKDISIHSLVNCIYFIFKQYNLTKWFYPCLMGTSYAYGGLKLLQYMKKCIPKTFGCENIFLNTLTLNEILKLSEQFQSAWTDEINEETFHTVGKVAMLCHFNRLMENIVMMNNQQSLSKLRLCDLFYFIIHLHPPYRFVNYSINIQESENGFEFCAYDFNCYK